MKAILLGLVFGAITSLALNADALSANEQTPTTQSTQAEQTSRVQLVAAQEMEGFTQIASASGLAPHNLAWTRDDAGIYLLTPNGVEYLDVASASRTELLAVGLTEMVLDISAQGSLAIIRSDGALVLRDARSGVDSPPLAQDADISSASFTPDGERVAVVRDNGTLLQVWDVATTHLLGEYTSANLSERAYSVSFGPSGEALTWYSAEGGQALDLATGHLGPFIAFAHGVVDVQMCSATSLVVAGNNGDLTLYDTRSAAVLSDTALPVFSNSCSLLGDTLLITTTDAVSLLDSVTFSPLQSVAEEAFDAEFGGSGQRFVVIGVDGDVSVWERD